MTSRQESTALIGARLNESVTVKAKMIENPQLLDLIAEIAEKMVEAIRAGHKILLFGNGGSAADAQHLAAELVGKFYLLRAPLPAMSLTVNTSSITAVGNDFSYDEIFEKQLRGLGQTGDVAIGISTSGNSGNVVRALTAAKEKGMVTVAFTGSTGGKLKSLVDFCLAVPSDDTPRIQEAHITAGHIICEIVEKEMFATQGIIEKT